MDNYIKFLFEISKDDTGNLISKCFQVEHSEKLIEKIILKLKGKKDEYEYDNNFTLKFISKMLKFSDFKNEKLVSFIKNEIGIKQGRICIEFLDYLDTIFEWIIKVEPESGLVFVSSSIIELVSIIESSISSSAPVASTAYSFHPLLLIRIQALKCKFRYRSDIEFINESIELYSKLYESSLNGSSISSSCTFKKDLLSLAVSIDDDQIRIFLNSLLSTSTNHCKFALGLQGFNQFLQISKNVPIVFSIFNDNLDEIYLKSIKFNLIPSFLASLKLILQLKRSGFWESKGISSVLGILRKALQVHPSCFDEIFAIYRLIINLHLRQFKNLLPILISNICESFNISIEIEESLAIGRTISELSSLKRGELEAFALLPIISTFISTKYQNNLIRKPIQLSINNLMYHLGARKQLLQLLSTALIVEHEHRLILKSVIDEYNKFYKYSGRS